ncbi:hypothetical protein GH714_004176 [Hevea brasiliensis]|uniref:Uncharacterized protein n=1 Tax=Hevea brasiliensis TaxID=3981 RepID=A0A6A6KGM1_HEVBR|nr:hypothetical protein GH714_004176 [Hevea brasiliensis]
MKSRTNGVPRGQKAKDFQVEGPNWILIAGGALLSTLSIRLGYKLKQTLDSKQQTNASNSLKGLIQFMFQQVVLDMSIILTLKFIQFRNGKSSDRRRVGGCHMRSNVYSFAQDDDGCFHCMSESGSDIYNKREVIQKLRQQLKRRDDMIMEMQDQIVELQSSINAQLAHSTNLQSQLDAANRDLFESEREIQRLRKAIADHCVKHAVTNEKLSTATIRPSEVRNGHANGYLDGDSSLELSKKGRGDGDKIDMLKREVGDLKEVIEGKEYLLQSYKEQKAELSIKIKELQQRLDSHLPNIL